jgi:hypothetical protein
MRLIAPTFIIPTVLYLLMGKVYDYISLEYRNRQKKMVFFSAYNFFNTMQDFSTSYISIDRHLLLFFFTNLQKV